jgi:hypothetical protein
VGHADRHQVRRLYPRRDSNSRVNIALGGRTYPGEHHMAEFEVEETDQQVRVA